MLSVTDSNVTCPMGVRPLSVRPLLHPVVGVYDLYLRVAVTIAGSVGNGMSLVVLARYNRRDHWIVAYFIAFTAIDFIYLFLVGTISWLKTGLDLASNGTLSVDVLRGDARVCEVWYVLKWTLIHCMAWTVALGSAARAFFTKHSRTWPVRRKYAMPAIAACGLAVASPFLYAIPVYKRCTCVDELFVFTRPTAVLTILGLAVALPCLIAVVSNMVTIALSLRCDPMSAALASMGGMLTTKRRTDQRYTAAFLLWSTVYCSCAVSMAVCWTIYATSGHQAALDAPTPLDHERALMGNACLVTMRVLELRCALNFPIFCVVLPYFRLEVCNVFASGCDRSRLTRTRNSIMLF